MRNLYLYIIVFSGLFACAAKKEKAATPIKERSRTVIADAFIVKTTPLSENIEVAGSLLPAEGTDIRPEITGRLVSINFKEGSFVKKGTLLAKLFDDDLQAQLDKLEVQLEINQKTVERYKELLKIQGISQQDVDLSELQVSNNKADIELVKVDIAKTEIRAPFDGRIGLRNISLGAYVSPADVIATIRQVDQLKLEFTVPEKYSTNFVPGKTVSFSIDGVSRKFDATVLATEYFIDANTRSLNIKALVKGKHPSLLPGAFAKVALDLAKDNNAIIIPTQAVIPLSHGKQVIVYKNGTPEFLPVITGIRDSVYLQITSGVNIGDTVLTSGLMAVQPDSEIQLSKIQ
ncbi:efflux RND transporter periplasmic adaptor subunit [Agriterribacter sp.]|uniref:efflux RND transporter periplasmic adaptor subunit n=1 Tax=Agriterribacter sp. TaxID=2821509 RepID=UPI002D01EC22|nr:efflux RND transporter periplasmic adaptor subunit [Agriterribacter sp.]HRP54868.1 efflux RND transporter periplasmic adaptor subunit [Agriterribacter sp.]